MAWQLTGDHRYAWKAREIFLATADAYEAIAETTHPYVWGHQPQREQPDYLVGNREPGMHEAAILANLAERYDLIADSDVLSPEHRRRIRADLFELGISKLRKDPAYGAMNNQGVCQQGKVGVISLMLEDSPGLTASVKEFQKAVGYGILEGGYWWEGYAYRRMSLNAMMFFAEAMTHVGLNRTRNTNQATL